MKFCSSCGHQNEDAARFCEKCAAPFDDVPENADGMYHHREEPEISEVRRFELTLICGLFGFLGAHRFYTGKKGTGILWLFTLGVFGFGTLIDLLMICSGDFKDYWGRRIIQ